MENNAQIQQSAHRSLATINQHWWYRLLKVSWLTSLVLLVSAEVLGGLFSAMEALTLEGTLIFCAVALATCGFFEFVRRAFYFVYFGTIAPKKGEEVEQKKRALQKALRTAQQMAARTKFTDIKFMSPAGMGLFFTLLFTLSVVVTIVQVISNRLTEKEGVRELAQTVRELYSAQKAFIENDDNDTKTTNERQGASNTAAPLDWKPGREQQEKTSRRVEDPKEFFQRLSETVKELGQKALIDQKRIAAEIDRIVETMLLPEALTDKSGIEDNRRKLKRWSDLLERGLTRSRIAKKELEDRIGSIASGSKYETGILDGMAEGMRNQEHLERQMYANHKTIIAVMTKMNEFMAARLGKVVVQDGQLMFNTQDEIDTFNEYVDEISKQEKLAADVQQRYLQRLQQGLMDISELAR